MADRSERQARSTWRERGDQERRRSSTTEHARLLSTTRWRHRVAGASSIVSVQRQLFEHVQQQVVVRQQIR